MQNKPDARKNRGGDKVFFPAYRAGARYHTNDGDEHAGACKRNRFQRIRPAGGVVGVFGSARDHFQHTLRRNIRHCHAYVPKDKNEGNVDIFTHFAALRFGERNERERKHREYEKRERREQNPRAHFARLEVGAVNEISDYEVGNDTYKLCRKNNKRDSDKIESHNFVEKLRLITVDKTYRKVDAHHAKGVNPHIPRKA